MKKIWFPHLSNISPEAEIGDGCTIHSHVWIGDNVTIGENCQIEAFCFIPPYVIIEDNVFLGPRVTFTNDKHPPSHGKGWQQTWVKKGAVIGAGSIIMPGITIGKGAVIGAGSLVTHSVPDGETWFGVPARKFK